MRCCSSISSNSVLIPPRPRHQNPSSHFRSETFTMFDLVLNRETNPKYRSKQLVSIQKKLDNLTTMVDELSSIADASYYRGFPWHRRGDGIFKRRSNPFWKWNSRLTNVVVYICRFNTFVREYGEDAWPPMAPILHQFVIKFGACLLYTSPSPRDYAASRMPSSA